MYGDAGSNHKENNKKYIVKISMEGLKWYTKKYFTQRNMVKEEEW